MNIIKPAVEEPNEGETTKEAVAAENKTISATRKFMSSINIFSFMEKERIIRMMPFVFFLTLLAMIYIANSYYSERTIRELDATGKEIRELRSEFISVQSDLMMKSKQTEVLAGVQAMGLKQSLEPPKKIVITRPAKQK